MKIIIEGNPKEIADLVVQIQNRHIDVASVVEGAFIEASEQLANQCNY